MQLCFICVSLVTVFSVLTSAAKNNVCHSFIGYNTKQASFSDCYYYPDADTNDPEQLIKLHAPHVETHKVTTEDGYILTLLRIPKENSTGVVWLGHPVLVDGLIWIAQGNDSLGFLAWEAGYEVWLPCNRGTTLSLGHRNFTSKDYKYWDFSFHEIGIYDYPAISDYIYTRAGGKPVIFVGHSTGSASSLIYASLLPNHAKQRIKLFINMATPANFKYSPLYLKIGARLEVILKVALKFLRVGSMLNYDNWYVKLLRFGDKFYPFNTLHKDVYNLVAGWNPNEAEPDQWGLTIPKTPRGQSVKILHHYAQLVKVETSFQQYDYGKKQNTERYGKDKPPKYPLDKINVPFYFVFTDKDKLANEKDNAGLYASLPKQYQKGKHVATGINHFDYFIGKSRRAQIYDHVLSVLENNI